MYLTVGPGRGTAGICSSHHGKGINRRRSRGGPVGPGVHVPSQSISRGHLAGEEEDGAHRAAATSTGNCDCSFPTPTKWPLNHREQSKSHPSHSQTQDPKSGRASRACQRDPGTMPDLPGRCSATRSSRRERSEEPARFHAQNTAEPSGSLLNQKYLNISKFLLPSTWEFYRFLKF